METVTQDTIERTLTIRAPQERVWKLLTEPDQVVKWFCSGIEGDYSLGNESQMIFEGYGRCTIRIDVWEPQSRFGYRWIPGTNDPEKAITPENSTLVLFTLVPQGDITELQMVESGFASLPAEVRAKALKENSSGWDYELRELAAMFE